MARTGRPRTFDEGRALEAAKDFFWRHGYAATSVRDLTQQLGVLPGSLYAAFGDKHSLFLRALERYADGTREAAAALSGDGPVLPRVRALLEGVLAAAHTVPGRGCMLGNTAAEAVPDDDAASEVVRAAFRELEAGLERAVATAQRGGEIRDELDCGAYARLLLALMQGLHVLARAERDPSRLQDAIDAALMLSRP